MVTNAFREVVTNVNTEKYDYKYYYQSNFFQFLPFMQTIPAPSAFSAAVPWRNSLTFSQTDFVKAFSLE